MVSSVRQAFNQQYSDETYQLLLKSIEQEFPHLLDFRVAESPVYIPSSLKTKLLMASNDILDTLLRPDFKSLTERAIPAGQYVPNENSHPHFIAIDYAISKNDAGDLEPQLIELQGFPSLFAYQWYISQKYQKFYLKDPNYSSFFNRLNVNSYIEALKPVLLGNERPENVVLLEIYPDKQKTRIDFALTQRLWGITPVCLTEVIQEGKELFYVRDGKRIPIHRIYNRVIFDDLERNFPGLKTNFDPLSEIEAQWVTHPNWFFRISKFTLPLLKSRFVPESTFVSDLSNLPDDLENYVLKPLFSFAGSGVVIDVQKEHLMHLEDPENYLLQRKVTYEPVVKDPRGEKIKVEIRLLYIWPDGAPRPQLVTNLARLSRGKMIGVDFNKNFDWVGGSCGFFDIN